MTQHKNRFVVILGWLLILIAIGLFCLQAGYLLVHERLQVEYIDDRLFYIFNIVIVICLYVGIILLFTFTKTFKTIGAGLLGLFLIANAVLLIQNSKETQHITSLSPDFQHTFVVKINHHEAVYYRVHYGILARPKEKLSYDVSDQFHVKWLENDVATLTYETPDHQVQQFIGTYGDRKHGISYYKVGAEIHGEWHGDNVKVVSDPKGIRVVANDETHLFEWEQVEQFGTLAIVLKQDDEAAWTIALNQDFNVHSNARGSADGSITLYRAAIDHHEAYQLQSQSSQPRKH